MTTDPYSHQGLKILLIVLAPGSTIVVATFALSTAVWSYRRASRLGLVSGLLLAFAAVLSWWAVVPLAVTWSGWVDPDGDGLYADFQNGAFGKVEYFGGHWGVLVLLASALLLGVLVTIRKKVAARERTEIE